MRDVSIGGGNEVGDPSYQIPFLEIHNIYKFIKGSAKLVGSLFNSAFLNMFDGEPFFFFFLPLPMEHPLKF